MKSEIGEEEVNMKKYFVCSDIHGFYTEWMSCLKEAGYDKDNNEHILIVLGDIFDRGKEPWKVYTFLKSIPENRVVLVKGNHEYLLLELVKRKIPFENDYSNGTYETLISFHKDPRREQKKWILDNAWKYEDNYFLYRDSCGVFRKYEKELYDNNKINEIVEWIKSPRWINYYELGKYIFAHSFIPLKGIDNIYAIGKIGTYYPNWRKEKEPIMWEMATWGCPYHYYLAGCFDQEEKKGKILVCGHWHTSDFYNHLLYKNTPSKQLNIKKSNPIFKSDKYPGIIAIDACTVLTKKVNVLVISENEIN